MIIKDSIYSIKLIYEIGDYLHENPLIKQTSR